MPLVTAETWCIIDTDSGGKLLNGKLANHKTKYCTKVTGTSANLKKDDTLTLN